METCLRGGKTGKNAGSALAWVTMMMIGVDVVIVIGR